ncbi:MAG: hypothetical protein BMS9Abin28_2084 [Anaerolineae bacterium]|nr:MAG: hypothetical protein BMS9Abin28_2084 [Anaerolineae bacterium]
MAESGGLARTLSRFAAGVFGLIFAITLPLTLVAFAWGNVLFSAQQMTDIFTDELVGSGALQEIAVEVLLDQVPRGGEDLATGILDFLGRQRLDEMIAALFPAEWAESQVRANIESLYAWIDNDLLAPELFLDVQPLKDRLLSGGAEDLATTIVSSWPTCGLEQLEILLREGVPKGELPAFLCQPPEPLRTTVIALATELVLRQVSELPTTVEIGDDRPLDTSPQELMEFKRGLRMLRAFSRAGWLLPLSMLGLIVAVAVRSWPQLLRWWGGSILAAGVGTFLMLGVVEGTVDQARNSGPLRTALPGPFALVIQDVIDRLLDAVSGQLFFLGLLIAGIGLAMLVGGIYLGRRAASLSLSEGP